MTDDTGIKTHDPLCYAIDKLWAQEADGSWRCMDCAFIAKVRADERKQCVTEIEDARTMTGKCPTQADTWMGLGPTS